MIKDHLDMKPEQLIAAIRAAGARVEVSTEKVRIYPADRDHPPITMTHRQTDLSKADGTHRVAVAARLRRVGIDLTATEEPTVSKGTPTPADVAPQRPQLVSPIHRGNASDPKTSDDLLELIGELEGRLGALESSNANLCDRIEELEARLAAGPAPRVTRTSIIRALVQEYTSARPGEVLTPQVIEMNLRAAGTLPEDTSKTMVAGICADLAKEGKLEAGGKDGPFRGTYRFPLPEEAK